MATLPSFSNRQLNARLMAYHQQMLALAMSSIAGDISRLYFTEEMQQLIQAAIPIMFRLAGGNPDRVDAQYAIRRHLAEEMADINKLAADIRNGRYAPAEAGQTAVDSLAKLENRLSLRTFSLAGIYTAAQDFRPRDSLLVWRMGSTRDHCRHCFGLNGATLTIFEWNQLGIRPQSRALECGGYRCDCERVPTDAPSVGLNGLVF
jgi:hypothetical protein